MLREVYFRRLLRSRFSTEVILLYFWFVLYWCLRGHGTSCSRVKALFLCKNCVTREASLVWYWEKFTFVVSCVRIFFHWFFILYPSPPTLSPRDGSTPSWPYHVVHVKVHSVLTSCVVAREFSLVSFMYEIFVFPIHIQNVYYICIGVLVSTVGFLSLWWWRRFRPSITCHKLTKSWSWREEYICVRTRLV
jgi:hypothetical protein